MKNQLTIALIQTSLHWENPNANRVHFQKKIEALTQQPDIVFLPEMFTTGFTMNPAPFAETMQGQTISWMQTMAQKINSALTGSLIIKENNQYFNRLLFVTPNGKIEKYDKKHLFSYANEDKHYAPGNEKKTIHYQGWKLCPFICYDLRFPVWSRNTNNYDVVFYLANWPKSRIQAWDALLPARAIENMAYCVGVNRVGIDGNNVEYIGHSNVFDPLGNNLINPINTTKDSPRFATLEKKQLQNYSSKYPFLRDSDSFKLT